MTSQPTLFDSVPTYTDRAAISRQIREMLAAWNELPADGSDRAQISSPESVAALMEAAMRDLQQEEFHVLLLDNKNRVLRDVCLYRGTVNSLPIRTAEVFREAIRDNAVSIVCVHNHPSGDPTPSPEDVKATRAIVAAGKVLDIEVLDHLVIGRDCHVSLRKRGMGF